METERIYDKDPKMTEFEARVLSCEPTKSGYVVVLNRTAFFPEGGGQFGDRGLLGDAHVLDTQTRDGVILHYTDGFIAPYETVEGKVDWDTRFSRMQSHTGEHIVSGLVHSTFGFDNIGFHLGDDDVTCDYNGDLTDENILDIERRANEAVFADLPVTCEYPDPEELPDMEYRSKLDLTENVRIVTIPGIDVCACCAPHVSSTGEIGLIKIVSSERAHGGTRLHLRIGRAALADYEEKQEQMQRIINLTSARQFETADAVEKLYEQIAGLEHDLSVARSRQGEIALSTLPAHKRGNIVLCLPGADTDALRALANGGKAHCTGIFVALTESDGGYRYMMTSDHVPLRAEAAKINAALNGRGGGSDDMLQGAFAADLSAIEEFFEGQKF